ncbi:unnamed protein product [Prunus armeniaca]
MQQPTLTNPFENQLAATTRGGIFASSIHQSASRAGQPRRSTSSSQRGSQPSPPRSRGSPT